MGRPVKEIRLNSRAERARLKARDRPYWRDIGDGVHLGYRRHVNGGVWVVRRNIGGDSPYASERFAEADDGDSASDGEKILTYEEALARAPGRALRLAGTGSAVERALVTVADAIAAYVDAKAAEEDKRSGADGAKRRDAKSRLTKHVLATHPALAGKKLTEVTANDLHAWRLERERSVGDASARRVMNYFRASLNAVAVAHRKRFPGLGEEVRAGFRATKAVAPVAREHQILPPSDIRRIITAAAEVDHAEGWGGDLLILVAVLAATGARFSQVVRMRVGDVGFTKKRLLVPVSAKGRGEKAKRHVAVQVGDDIMHLLRQYTARRRTAEDLFLRPRWRQERVGVWIEVGRAPWRSSSELTRPWAQIITAAGLPPETIPYALRHSSIVRGLEAGLPIRLVAALHDTSSVMIERHYSAYVVDAMEELAARAIVPLATQPEAVIDLRRISGVSR